ncbi:MAG: hypothetical protein HKN50_05500 [Gammaproteobacteria bacterium]|nr:hypothetical protein [Gammaproteobacteria bacterium]
MNWNLVFSQFAAAALTVRWTLLIALVVIAVLVGGYLVLEKPSYKTSWIMLLPGTDRSATLNLDNLGESRTSGNNAYGSVSISPKNTYKEIALSDAVISRAAAEYGVEPVAFSKPRITLIDQTPAMKFTLKGESQDELVYRANLYNNTFHQTLDELRQNEIERNFQGVESNLAEAKARLNAARQNIVAYQAGSEVISDQQFERWLDDLEQLRTEHASVGVTSAQLGATIATTLEQLSISEQQARELLVIQSNPTVHSLLETLSVRLAEQTSNNSRYAEQNPLRRQLDAEVNALKTRLRNILADYSGLVKLPESQLFGLLSENAAQSIQQVNELLAEFKGLQAQGDILSSNLQSYGDRVRAHTQAAATLADLQRDHQIAEAIFSSALAKLDTSRLDIYATYPLTQLLTQPGATLKRDRLQAKLMIVAGVLLYGLLALALILTEVRRRLGMSSAHTATGNTNFHAAMSMTYAR